MMAVIMLVAWRKVPVLIWVWIGMGIIALTGVVIWSGIPTNRYTIIVLPAVAILFGYGVLFITEKLPHHKHAIATLFIGGMALAGIFFAIYPQYESLMYRDVHWREPTREFVLALQGRTSAEHALIFHPQELSQVAEVLPLYLRRHDVAGVPSLVDTWQRPTQEQYIEQAYRIMDGREMLWVGMSQPETRFGELFKYLITENGFSDCGIIHREADLNISAYLKMPAERGIRFGDAIRIAPMGGLAVHDDVLSFPLAVDVGDGVDTPYSVAVHVDGINPAMEQMGFSLPIRGFRCEWVRIDLSRLNAGEYTVLLTVYDANTGERLLFIGADTSLERAILGLITR